MELTSQVIDQKLEEVKAFEKRNFGMRYGLDFPTIAQLLVHSKSFTETVTAQAMLGIVQSMTLANRYEYKNVEEIGDRVLDDIQNSPVREGLAIMFYVGFKLGQQFTEVRQLDQMTRGE